MELIKKIKHAYAIYHEVNGISKTIEYCPKLTETIEELNHYPQSILILAIIEAVKKTISDKRGKFSKEELFEQTLDLISHVHCIKENIDMSKINHVINNEVH